MICEEVAVKGAMRILLLIPAALGLTAASGLGACAVMRLQPHVTEMLAAVIAVALACVAGAAPVVFQRRATQLIMSQAALVGTLIHLLVTIVLAAVVLFGKFNLHNSFVYWLMAFYWASLMALAASGA